MLKNKKNYFISLEGVEGVGKSTAIHVIRDTLSHAGIDYIVTREPGGTPIAEAIRRVLLSNYDEKMQSDTELLLMFASRAQNLKEIILPALKKGQWVIADRFVDASFAYQGGGRGIPFQRIESLAKWVLGDFQPDLTILLDASVEVGFKRIDHRGSKDRIESEDYSFFQRVRAAYLERAQLYPERFCIINAEHTEQEVKEDILNIMKNLILESQQV